MSVCWDYRALVCLWTTAWDTQGQACHRMWWGCGAWVFSFSHRPWDTYRTSNTHSCKETSWTWLGYFTHWLKKVFQKCRRDSENTCTLVNAFSTDSFIHKHNNNNTQHTESPFPPQRSPTQRLMNLFWIPSPFAGTTFQALKIAAKTKRGSDVRALPLNSPLNLSQSCRLALPRLPLGPTQTNAVKNGQICCSNLSSMHINSVNPAIYHQAKQHLPLVPRLWSSLSFFQPKAAWLWLAALFGPNLNFFPTPWRKCRCIGREKWRIHL